MIPVSVRRWMLAVLLVSLSPAYGGDAPAPLDRRIDIDLVDAGAGETFASFAAVVGGELDLAPAVAARKISIRLQNVRVRTALDAACESLGCGWKLEKASPGGGDKLKVTELATAAAGGGQPPRSAKLDEKLSLDLLDAKMEQVLGTFARILDAKLELDPGLAGGEVTIKLTNVRLADALDAVLGERWTWGLEDHPAGRRLIVRPRGR